MNGSKCFLWISEMWRRLLCGAVLLGAAGSQAFAADSWIEGTSTLADGHMLYVRVQGRTLDSVRISSGRFRVACRVAEPAVLTLCVGPRSVEVVADGPAHVDFDRGVVGGTPENDALCKWNNLLRGYQVQMDSASAHILRLLSRLEKGEDDQRAVRESLGQWQQTYQRQQQLWREALYTCLRDNIHYYFPAVFLQRYPDAVDRTALLRLSQQDPLYLQGEAMQGMWRDLEAWRLRQPGQLLPDLTLPDLVSGTPRALSSFAGPGSCVLVCFWAGWCGDCIGFMTRVRRLYRTYHRRGLEVVGVSLDTDADVWRRAVRSLRLPWPQLCDMRGWQSRAVARYGLNRIPDNLLLGPDGRIVANDIPADSLERVVSRLLPP